MRIDYEARNWYKSFELKFNYEINIEQQKL